MDFKAFDISIVPIIMFLTKVVTDVGIPKKYAPLISLGFGIPFGIFYFSQGSIARGVLMGIFLAASSVGFYSGSKNLIQEYRAIKQQKNKN